MTIRDVHVLSERCLAHGVCQYVLPQIFDLSGTTATLTAAARQRFADYESAILEVAEDLCPVSAIEVEKVGPPIRPDEFSTFGDAVAHFSAFLRDQGRPANVLWIYREDVILGTHGPIVRWPVPESNESFASISFTRGRNRGLGVELSAHYTIHDKTLASVWYPRDSIEAEYALISGIKYSAAVRLLGARASRLPWWIQRRRPAYRRTQTDLEFLPTRSGAA